MVAVLMVAVAAVVVVVVKVLVWAAAVINMVVVVEVTVIGVDIIVVAIVLNFVLPTWYLVDVLSDVLYVNLFVMLDVLPGVGFEVFACVNVNCLLAPLEEFSP